LKQYVGETYIVKRIGLKIEHLGTPQDNDKMEEEAESEVTENDLLER
jgi:hypothetical protein